MFEKTEEVADLSALGKYRAAIDALSNRVQEADRFHRSLSGTMTARFIDEKQVAGSRPYFVAHARIGAGLEHYEALWSLITEGPGLSPRAPYALMRPILEHGFWAQYVLDPEQSRSRRRRGLEAEYRDRAQRKAWAENYAFTPAAQERMSQREAEILKIYRAEAEQVGGGPLTTRKPDMTCEILELSSIRAVAEETARMYIGAWRLLSGVTHGAIYALQVTSDIEERERLEHGVESRVTVNDDWFVMNVQASLTLLVDAMSLYAARGTEPLSEPRRGR